MKKFKKNSLFWIIIIWIILVGCETFSTNEDKHNWAEEGFRIKGKIINQQGQLLSGKIYFQIFNAGFLTYGETICLQGQYALDYSDPTTSNPNTPNQGKGFSSFYGETDRFFRVVFLPSPDYANYGKYYRLGNLKIYRKDITSYKDNRKDIVVEDGPWIFAQIKKRFYQEYCCRNPETGEYEYPLVVRVFNPTDYDATDVNLYVKWKNPTANKEADTTSALYYSGSKYNHPITGISIHAKTDTLIMYQWSTDNPPLDTTSLELLPIDWIEKFRISNKLEEWEPSWGYIKRYNSYCKISP